MTQAKLPPEEIKDLASQMAFIAGLNQGIRLTVALLRRHGFETIDSGDGETHEHECDREVSYVSISVEPDLLRSECHRLASLLLQSLRDTSDLGAMGVSNVAIQGSYDPMDLTAVIDVTGIHDRMLAPWSDA